MRWPGKGPPPSVNMPQPTAQCVVMHSCEAPPLLTGNVLAEGVRQMLGQALNGRGAGGQGLHGEASEGNLQTDRHAQAAGSRVRMAKYQRAGNAMMVGHHATNFVCTTSAAAPQQQFSTKVAP